MPSMGVENKEKKMKENVETPDPMRIEKSKKESKKKRNASDTDVDAKPSRELEVEKLKKKSKKVKVEEDEENPNAVSKFRISQPLRAKLKERGIKSLCQIGARTFDTILDGFDFLGQAPADQDKTLAFVLPILESIKNASAEQSKKSGYRTPGVMVLLPTRDSAVQVLKEFGFYGGSLGLVSCCVYGGSSHKVQTKKLKRGRVDIIVGTPGRVKDHIEKGNLDLSSLKFRVLGEADELWKTGLVEDVEFILGKVNDVSKVQTLLFSTKLPRYVEKIIISRYLKSNYKEVELVSNEKMKASPSKGGLTEERNGSFTNQEGAGRSNYGNKW